MGYFIAITGHPKAMGIMGNHETAVRNENGQHLSSLVAKPTNPEMFFTAKFVYGNVMYMVWGVRRCRMLICILWEICIIKLISIFN